MKNIIKLLLTYQSKWENCTGKNCISSHKVAFKPTRNLTLWRFMGSKCKNLSDAPIESRRRESVNAWRIHHNPDRNRIGYELKSISSGFWQQRSSIIQYSDAGSFSNRKIIKSSTRKKSSILVKHSEIYRILRTMVDDFWYNWQTQVIFNNQCRPKSYSTKQENFIVGDIILIKQCKMGLKRWPIGVITEIYPSKDDGLLSENCESQNFEKLHKWWVCGHKK